MRGKGEKGRTIPPQDGVLVVVATPVDNRQSGHGRHARTASTTAPPRRAKGGAEKKRKTEKYQRVALKEHEKAFASGNCVAHFSPQPRCNPCSASFHQETLRAERSVPSLYLPSLV